MVGCDAIWLGGIKLNGTRRLLDGARVAIVDGKLVDADYATHKIIGLWQADGGHVALVTDVLTNEPKEFIINY